MKTFKISEIKEQGIWVKCTLKDALRLIKAFDYEQFKDYLADDRIDIFYKWNGCSFSSKSKSEYAPTSYIEFIRLRIYAVADLKNKSLSNNKK